METKEISFNSLISNVKEIIYRQNNLKRVNLKKKWYHVTVMFKNHVVDIYVKLIAENLVFKLAKYPEKDTSCLKITIHKNLEASLDLVKIPERGGICDGLPSENIGTWLVEFSSDLLCFLGVKYVNLVDVSDFKCKNSDNHFSAKMYRLYNKQKTFYEKFGYKHVNKTNLIDQYLNQKFIDIIRFAENQNDEYGEHILDKSFVMLNLLNELSERGLYQFRNPDPNISISSYMNQLYKVDCDIYSVVDDFIYFSADAIVSFDPETAKIEYPWAWLYIEINTELYLLENYLDCQNNAVKII